MSKLPTHVDAHLSVCDVVGEGWSFDLSPSKILDLEGNSQLFVAKEDKSKYIKVENLPDKTAEEQVAEVQALCNWSERQSVTQSKVKQLRSHSAAEYTGMAMAVHKKQEGLEQKLGFYDPSKNAFAETGIKEVKRVARQMLLRSGAPIFAKGEAYKYSQTLLNLTPPHKGAKITRYEMFRGRPSALSKINIPPFGVGCWDLLERMPKRPNMPKAMPAMFVGMDEEHSCYRVLRAGSRKVTLSRNVRFPPGIPQGWKWLNSQPIKNLAKYGNSEFQDIRLDPEVEVLGWKEFDDVANDDDQQTNDLIDACVVESCNVGGSAFYPPFLEQEEDFSTSPPTPNPNPIIAINHEPTSFASDAVLRGHSTTNIPPLPSASSSSSQTPLRNRLVNHPLATPPINQFSISTSQINSTSPPPLMPRSSMLSMPSASSSSSTVLNASPISINPIPESCVDQNEIERVRE
eukprot:gb/GEZN01001011.1/.p1 GENE.gb/GEZN01001011.1/~~gb/GEZN01001011.1/.p1  ORF type:complete len:460 (+),score=78.30 gb/GEZN01001011.1/:3-1382(+)